MDLGSPQNLVLLGLALAFLVAAVAARKFVLSLFFSLVYTLFVSGILLSIGHPVLASASFFLSSTLNYTMLLTTSLLIGSRNGHGPKRRLSILRALFILIVLSLAAVFGYTLTIIKDVPELSHVTLKPQADWAASPEFALSCVVLAIVSLAAFLTALLLIRFDDVIDKGQEKS